MKGARGAAGDLAELAAMVARFAASAADLVVTLFPRYAPYVQRARTSFRPQPAVGRHVSWRKDDSRLHVDAFPSRPNHGERILRVFSNVSPDEDRVWRVGEPFEAVARTFLPRIRDPLPGSAAVLAALHVTKSTAQRLRPPDARPARPREGGHDLPAGMRAAGRAFRAGNDVALLLGPGHACRGVGPVHAGADDQPAGGGAVRRGEGAAGDSRAAHRAHAGSGPVESATVGVRARDRRGAARPRILHPMLDNDTFLRALKREPTPYTPIWLMRQAGRYLPEYNVTRAAAGSFMALAQNPALATEVTLQPLARFPLDAAILFSDILTIPDAMGLGLSFAEGEGPRFARTARDEAAIAALAVPDMAKLRYVFDAVAQIKRALKGRVPLIGFAGQPVHAGLLHDRRQRERDFANVRRMAHARPDLLARLVAVNTQAVTAYLNEQIAAGADAVMIFDTWGGLLTTDAYRRFSLAPMRDVIAGLHHGARRRRDSVHRVHERRRRMARRNRRDRRVRSRARLDRRHGRRATQRRGSRRAAGQPRSDRAVDRSRRPWRARRRKSSMLPAPRPDMFSIWDTASSRERRRTTSSALVEAVHAISRETRAKP